MNNTIKAQILRDKLALWENTIYSHKVDVEVADTISDNQMKANAVKALENAIKGRDTIKKLLAELEKQDIK